MHFLPPHGCRSVFPEKSCQNAWRSGSQLARGQVNLADEANLVVQFVQLLKYWLCDVKSGNVMKHWTFLLTLFLISSASVRSIPFLSFIEPIFCMKYSLDISNFLEAIPSLSHSVVYLYFFALIAEEGFLISPGYSLVLCIQMEISFLFSFAFCFSSFHSYL